MRTLVNITCTAIRVCVITKRVDIARRHQSSYGVAWLNLTAPIDFWRNSTQFFGVKVHALPVPPTRCSCLPWIYITALWRGKRTNHKSFKRKDFEIFTCVSALFILPIVLLAKRWWSKQRLIIIHSRFIIRVFASILSIIHCLLVFRIYSLIKHTCYRNNSYFHKVCTHSIKVTLDRAKFQKRSKEWFRILLGLISDS